MIVCIWQVDCLDSLILCDVNNSSNNGDSISDSQIFIIVI